MASYIVAVVNIKDPEQYQKYVVLAPAAGSIPCSRADWAPTASS